MKKEHSQKGSALIYILIAIALMAALTATFMNSSDQQASSQNASKLIGELKSQIEMIRSAIQECVLMNPKGDLAIAGTGAVGGENPVRPYPLKPSNTYLPSNPSPGYSYARDIGCPGNPGTSNNHAKIFGGSTGKFLPKEPSSFTPWMYYNDIDGVFIHIVSNRPDSYISTALQKLDAQFSKCESQYVDARSGDIHMTSNSVPGYRCAAGYQCFRLVILSTGTTIYPGETGCP